MTTYTRVRPMFRFTLAAACVLFLCSCSTIGRNVVPPPTWAQLDRADFGPMPKQAEHQVRELMARGARQPTSLRFTFGKLSRGWFRLRTSMPARFGWRLPFTVNGRNGFGGMTGPQQREAWFVGGRIENLHRPASGRGYAGILRGMRRQRLLHKFRMRTRLLRRGR